LNLLPVDLRKANTKVTGANYSEDPKVRSIRLGLELFCGKKKKEANVPGRRSALITDLPRKKVYWCYASIRDITCAKREKRNLQIVVKKAFFTISKAA